MRACCCASTASKLGPGSVSHDLAWPGLREAPHVSDYATRARPGKADYLLWPTIRLRLNPSRPFEAELVAFWVGPPITSQRPVPPASRRRTPGPGGPASRSHPSRPSPHRLELQPRRHEDHRRQAEAGEVEPDPRPQDRTLTS